MQADGYQQRRRDPSRVPRLRRSWFGCRNGRLEGFQLGDLDGPFVESELRWERARGPRGGPGGGGRPRGGGGPPPRGPGVGGAGGGPPKRVGEGGSPARPPAS